MGTLLLLVAACAPEADPSTSSYTEVQSELVASCDDEAATLEGTVEEGGACDPSLGCVPVCCPCIDAAGNEVSTARVSACVEGVCAAEEDVCAPADDGADSSYCG